MLGCGTDRTPPVAASETNPAYLMPNIQKLRDKWRQ